MTGLIKGRQPAGQTGYFPGFAYFIVSTSENEKELFAIAHDNNIDVDLKKISTSANKSEPGENYLQLLKLTVKVCSISFYFSIIIFFSNKDLIFSLNEL